MWAKYDVPVLGSGSQNEGMSGFLGFWFCVSGLCVVLACERERMYACMYIVCVVFMYVHVCMCVMFAVIYWIESLIIKN